MKLSQTMNLFFPQKCDACRQNYVALRNFMCHACIEKIQYCSHDQIETNMTSLYNYDRLGRKFLQKAKFEKNKYAIAKILGDMQERFPTLVRVEKIDWVAVAPSSRPFVNMVARRYFEKILGKPSINLFEKGKKKSLKELSRDARLQVIRQNLRLKANQKLPPGNVLLFDDVRASGATLIRSRQLLTEIPGFHGEIFLFSLFFRPLKNKQIVK